jgi:PAS domain S-box-containing protein
MTVCQLATSALAEVDVMWQRDDGDMSALPRPVAAGVTLADPGESVSTTGDAEARIRELEEQLRVSEERFRALADAAPVLIWMADGGGRCIYVNQGWRELAGRPLEQETGTAWADSIHPEDRDRCLASYGAAADRRETFSACYRRRRYDGTYRWLWDTGIPRCAPDGQLLGYFGACVDVTEQQERERGAVERAGKLTAVFEGMADAVVVLDREGRIERLNQAARALFERSAAPDFAARTLAERAAAGFLRDEHDAPLSPEKLPAYRILCGETLDGAQTVDIKMHLLAGGVAVYNVGGAPIRDEGGAIVGAVIIYRDVTKRRSVERDQLRRERKESREQLQTLEKANQQLDNFMGIASHELRTPLTVFKANLQMALRQARRLEAEELAQSASSGQAERLAALRTLLVRAAGAADRQQRLVDDLLDAARIRGGALRLQLEPVDLLAVVQQAVEEQRLSSPGRTINLTLPTGHLPIMAEAERIGQVVTNYLSNALKFTAEEQPVDVRAELSAGAGASVRAPSAGGTKRAAVDTHAWVCVSVRDEGPGIPLVEQRRIWERFQRVESIGHRSGSGLGLGLGLYISKTIVEEHGGAVGVESAPGAGAIFWFTLPLAE